MSRLFLGVFFALAACSQGLHAKHHKTKHEKRSAKKQEKVKETPNEHFARMLRDSVIFHSNYPDHPGFEH